MRCRPMAARPCQSWTRNGVGPLVRGGESRPVATAQLQGDYLARSFLVNLSQGIPLSIWYDWENDGTDPTNPEENFGTVTADLVAEAGL